MKRLFVFTSAFPFPAKSMETYLETECQYYDKFDEVILFALGVKKKTLSQERKLNVHNVKVYPILFAPLWVYMLNGVSALFDKNFYIEVRELIQTHRFNVRRLIRLLIFMSRSHYETRLVKKVLRKIDVHGAKNVAYVYRFEYHPYVPVLLKRELGDGKIISRAHGYDLYEERNSDQYIPLRRILLQELDSVQPISDDGKNYLSEKYPQYADKITVSRLGTLDKGIKECHINDNRIHLVSCSNVVPIKRLDKIIDALCLINQNVQWTHYGAGQDYEQIREYAQKLPTNIQCSFKGQATNQEVLKAYSEINYHLFLNLSESEGIPVSIMEAMSFGIPCIATAVGGTAEIVENNVNGVLLPEDVSPEQVSKVILRFMTMQDEDYQIFRQNARNIWNAHYNAETNYRQFTDMLYTKAE
ncbi:glycosyltransferase [Holdemania massiliensis]|uniref:glycosyltransferase n=1 Tax=Holdemania massiliensis TaxID=1468449 RepID=UPI0036F2E775